jgi:hypothetical protein
MRQRQAATYDDICARGQIGTAGLVRQSDPSQVVEHPGSRIMQTDLILNAAHHYRVRHDDVVLFEGKGESAAGEKARPDWERLLEMIRAGKLGLVIFADHHRLSRNTRDTDDLIRACRKHDVFILVGIHPFDVRQYQERGTLRLISAAVSLVSEGQVEWFENAKFTLAQMLAYRTPVPVGLVWANPLDLNYRSRMERAGLTEWLERIPQRHRSCSEMGPDCYYILPYPDADVFKACELRIRWLMETQSLTDVYRRIRAGFGGWPRRGLVPNRSFTRFRPDVPMTWATLDRRNMAQWYRNPFLYGAYVTYRGRYAATGTSTPREHKGAHYTRAGHRLLTALPDAIALLAHGASNALVVND